MSKKRKDFSNYEPALNLYILPAGKYGPNNQRLGIVWILEFCRNFNLQAIEPNIRSHYSDTHERDYSISLPFNSLYDVGDSITMKPLSVMGNQPSVDVVIVGSLDKNWEPYLKYSGFDDENASIYRAPTSGHIFPFLTNGVLDGSITSGSIVAIVLFPAREDVLLRNRMWSIPRDADLVEEPYLPAHWIRQKTLQEMKVMGLEAGTSGNFVAIHLRLWDQCFSVDYTQELTLGLCCCGVKVDQIGNGRTYTEEKLKHYIYTKLNEFNVSRALILGHPMLNMISSNTSWIGDWNDVQIMIWPTDRNKGSHSFVTLIMQQYMMTSAKEALVSNIESTIVTAVQSWRAYYGLPDVIPIPF